MPYALPHPSQGQICVRFFGFEELPEEPLALVAGEIDFWGGTLSIVDGAGCWEAGGVDGSAFTALVFSFALETRVVVAAFNSDSIFINAR